MVYDSRPWSLTRHVPSPGLNLDLDLDLNLDSNLNLQSAPDQAGGARRSTRQDDSNSPDSVSSGGRSSDSLRQRCRRSLQIAGCLAGTSWKIDQTLPQESVHVERFQMDCN